MMSRALPIFVLAALAVSSASFGQEINQRTQISPSANAKVGMIKAQGHLNGGNQKDSDGNIYDPNTDTLLHTGSASKGDCNMNVGGTKSGKETIVTTKNIINVCQ